MYPNLPKRDVPFILKQCTKCKGNFGPESYSRTRSIFYPDGYLPICNDCLEKILVDHEFNWDIVDKICQYADIPFVPTEFERLHEMNGNKVFPIYAEIFMSEQYEPFGWSDYFKTFKELREQHALEEQLPGLKEERRKKLQEKFGPNYDDEALEYLENLYNGLLMTQNVNGALQHDQALKICKISYELDCRIREGVEIDKMLAAYDKLVKVAEFTPRNTKNASDFDSMGEIVRWLEKRGWKAKYYDDVSRDIVDETIKNIQNSNRRLYINEVGIGEEITRRIEALKTANELEGYYDLDKEYDLDSYDNDGYEELIKEEFDTDIEGVDV